MSSGYSPSWKRFLRKYFKFLFIFCPEGNYHWRWNKLCRCCDSNEKPIFLYKKGVWEKIGEVRDLDKKDSGYRY